MLMSKFTMKTMTTIDFELVASCADGTSRSFIRGFF